MNKYVTISLPAELIEIIDRDMLGKYGYKTKTEFIKQAIRNELYRGGGKWIIIPPGQSNSF